MPRATEEPAKDEKAKRPSRAQLAKLRAARKTAQEKAKQQTNRRMLIAASAVLTLLFIVGLSYWPSSSSNTPAYPGVPTPTAGPVQPANSQPSIVDLSSSGQAGNHILSPGTDISQAGGFNSFLNQPGTTTLVSTVGSANAAPEVAPVPDDPLLTVSDSTGVRLSLNVEGAARFYDIKAVGPRHFRVTFPPEGPNEYFSWFIARVENAAGQQVQIDIKGVRRHWRSQTPVVCSDDDPSALKNFESRPVSNPRKPVEAAHGPLLPDTSGEQWHFVDEVTNDGKTHKRGRITLHVKHTYKSDSSLIAIRPPYTPSYHENYLASIESDPYVTVHRVGKSELGRPLSVIQVGGLTETARKENPCLFLYAREHADEQDGSWTVQGAIDWLRKGETAEARRLRDEITLLAIPLLDPDGAALGMHDRIMTTFSYITTVPEVTQERTEAVHYTQFLTNWVNAENRLDIVHTYHNPGAAGWHFQCAMIEPDKERAAMLNSLNNAVTRDVESSGYRVDTRPVKKFYAHMRLCKWCRHYGSMNYGYEVNARSTKRHLNLGELRQLGTVILSESARQLHGPRGNSLITDIDALRLQRARRWLMHYGDFDAPDDYTRLKAEDVLSVKSLPEWTEDRELLGRLNDALNRYPQYR
ncbi:M14 family zinc carboxypeptidase [Stratiformator vulcanicus]|uniref:M14 family zinc carboxypeptidase n=1 Tax=Stratiformator vulcanicus TaxID=2527980 RepID=UPI0028778C37|nr:M14 family zinc carboxypeptidase [Stratiformator vulcanicus]